jgi:hypothetical protein
MRSVQHPIRSASGQPLVLRVDLHGVSVSSPGGERTAIRWEWIDDIAFGCDETVVHAASGTITIPAGTFGLVPEVLAARLEEARSIARRTDVIQELAQGTTR